MRLCEYQTDAEFEAAYLAAYGLAETDLVGSEVKPGPMWQAYTWTGMGDVAIDESLIKTAEANMEAMHRWHLYHGRKIVKAREIWASRIGGLLRLLQIVDVKPTRNRAAA